MQEDRTSTNSTDKASKSKAYYDVNDARAEKSIQDALHRQEIIAFAADTNCYLIGGNQEADLQQSWQTKLSAMANGGLQFFIPSVWDEEIRKFIKKSIPQQLAFNPPRLVDQELAKAVDNLHAIVRRLKQQSNSIAEEFWAKHKAETKASLIEPRGESLRRVLDLYARVEPPFDVKKDKKHEFPDAFAIIALEDHARATANTKIVVATNDQGCLEFCKGSNYLIGVSSADKALSYLSSKEEIERLLIISHEFSSIGSGVHDLVKDSLRATIPFLEQFTDYVRGQWQQNIPGMFQPFLNLVDVESVRLLESGPHKLIFTVQSDSDYATDLTGRAEITATFSGHVSAYDPETQVGGRLPLFENQARTFLVDYTAHQSKQLSSNKGGAQWRIGTASSSTLIDLPKPPAHWEPRPMA